MLIVMVASRSLLRMEQIPGKGRGLVASQPLKAGQIVLTESPLILYSASPLLTPSSSPYTYCDHCFRILPLTHNSTTVTCPSCSNHSFCSQKCFSLALKSSHSTWVCKALTSLQQHPNSTLVLQQHPPGRQVQARLIVASHNLFLHTLSDIYTFFFFSS